MKLREFERDVIGLADDGVRLTVANVVARLRVEADKAEKWLDELAKEGKLDLEIDEDHGVIVYTVRGLTPRRASRGGQDPGTAMRLAELEAEIMQPEPVARRNASVHPTKKKSVLVAFLAALFLPGFGLFYAAPVMSAVIATAACILLMKLAAIPLIGWAIGGTVALSSGVAGALYASEYNKHGRRTEIVGRLVKQLPSK